MLRNKVGIKKMITGNALIVLPQDTDIPDVPANMGFDGSGNPGRKRSRNPIEKSRKELLRSQIVQHL
jgi:hypothetical protein